MKEEEVQIETGTDPETETETEALPKETYAIIAAKKDIGNVKFPFADSE